MDLLITDPYLLAVQLQVVTQRTTALEARIRVLEQDLNDLKEELWEYMAEQVK